MSIKKTTELLQLHIDMCVEYMSNMNSIMKSMENILEEIKLTITDKREENGNTSEGKRDSKGEILLEDD